MLKYKPGDKVVISNPVKTYESYKGIVCTIRLTHSKQRNYSNGSDEYMYSLDDIANLAWFESELSYADLFEGELSFEI